MFVPVATTKYWGYQFHRTARLSMKLNGVMLKSALLHHLLSNMYSVGLEISQHPFYCWPLIVRILLWMLTRDECSADMFHINCNIASMLLSRVTWNLDNTKRNENWYMVYVEYIIMHLCMPIFIYIKWRHCLWCSQLCK